MRRLLAIIVAMLAPCIAHSIVSVARADERRFTFVYETTTLPKGEIEYEQWVTWKKHKEEDPDYDKFEFRHEIEYGVTDNFLLALYVSDWSYEDGKSVDDDGVEWNDAAIEAIYSILNPEKDPFGLAVYGEFKGGDEVLGVEGKILVQKNIDRFVIAYNAVIEAEWEEEHYVEDNGTFEQTAGISYQISPKLLVGAEIVHELEFEDWNETGENIVHAGPNVSYRAKQWWVTLTPLFQLTDLKEEPDFITRLIVGVHF